ncbi:2-C-methyl-D-erythritol 4-phosphate cytidylyltransferase [Brachybacterium faecium]|uniref:4-diphosphocytidyl-2-methyl-D-erythritol synthase n=1 Tax=Brachybacterium faecium (strain ATCC 43885 / DSM 4810 / JCM 11609 / LMG 19847 / NBRC 14762 / NCIMB 9860 / 6-10) TaxID=446465 RepID=C7MAM1_BRAFD|nr:4-diphosphocytidyl-2-methyl-D-erythritol synthase [Brachybacterium faecium DSM 4810]SLM99873.1 2-C-methyl-D-erythritol 4-phosphate cytidylyltransferase [Brachybacterium faecium]
MSSAPLRDAVRPVVLALAPPAPGLSRGAASPCLEPLGGSRLIDRLLGTLRGVGLPAPLLVTGEAAAPQLRAALGWELPVLAVPGERGQALRAVLEATDEQLLLLHDAERALTPAQTIRDVLSALREDVDAVVPVTALTDSVKEVRPDGLLNIDRSTLAGLQSPRLLRRELLESVLSATASASPRPSAPESGRVPTGLPGSGPSPAEQGGEFGGFDEVREALARGARVRTVHGSHAGFAVLDRLSLWQAQISLGLARDTSHRHGLARHS